MNRLQIEKETLYQFPVERTDGRQAFPEPEQGECVCENPPTFVWLQLPCDQADDVVYRCSVTDVSGAMVRPFAKKILTVMLTGFFTPTGFELIIGRPESVKQYEDYVSYLESIEA